jgi:YaiO family outer membrane protein
MGRNEKDRFRKGGRAAVRKLCLILLALLSLYSVQVLSADKTKDQALQAIRAQNYDKAITICLEHLSANPDDTDYNFMLAQAYAYSEQWEKAMDVLEKMMAAHPENMDALLLWSRVQSWKKEYEAAKTGYNKALLSNPDNTEALIGLAETTSWEGDYAKALEVYKKILEREPSNPDIYFRLGRVYKWSGNYDKAKENFRKAIQLDPGNKEYQTALSASRPQFRNRFEIRYQHRIESFSDQRDNYRDQSFAFLFATPRKKETFLIKASQTRRFKERDYQFGIEFYPQLWNGAYGFFDLTYSSKALLYPQTSYVAEVYQAFWSSAELSLGLRRMNFEQNPVSIYLGSMGYYFGQFYTYFRWYYSIEESGNTFSWSINGRRYFSQDNFVFVLFGQGSRPFDAATVDDFFITQSRFFQAGVVWYFLQSIRLELHIQFTNERDGPDRNVFFLSSGYRW